MAYANIGEGEESTLEMSKTIDYAHESLLHLLSPCRLGKEGTSLEERALLAKKEEDWWNERKAALDALRKEFTQNLEIKDN